MTIISNIRTITLAVTGCLLGSIGATQAAPSVLSIQEQAKSDYTKTKYPLLMVHGWLGWSRIGNLDNDGMVARIASRLLNDLRMLEIQVHEDLLN